VAASNINIRCDSHLVDALRGAGKKLDLALSTLCRDILFLGLISLDTSEPRKVRFRPKTIDATPVNVVRQ